ncbi:VOC family protein [Nocardioides sp. Root151]|uniref:VOC family protein n=1 Tax=Nocardioides sp. Root151 TaxID=1736475 RepID=UPI000AC637C8|nr:VOC family protein [Nocardioides sp. Root151]
MYLENLVIDAVEPQRLGRFWEAVVGGETLTDDPEHGFETRLSIEGGPTLDLCFQPVTGPPEASPRLHLDLAGGVRQGEEVDRLLGLGARHLDIGQGDEPWVVLADPEGNALCVLEDRAEYADSGPVASFVLHSADPDRDGEFWAWLTSWSEVTASAPRSLRHPSLKGPLLEFCAEPAPKGATKNRLHLDVRLERGEDADEVEALIAEHGGSRLRPEWGELPWRSYLDPSGNEFCILPPPQAQQAEPSPSTTAALPNDSLSDSTV